LANPLTPKSSVYGDVVDINFFGQEPKKNVADDPAVDFRQDGSGARNLKLLQKEIRTPWMTESGSFNDHYLIQIGWDHRPE
jgi:hypothetical protein